MNGSAMNDSAMNDGDGVRKKWVLVTGGTRGIGKGLVEAFCDAGYEVVFTYQHSRQAAVELQRAVAERGGVAAGYCCDSSDEAAVQAFGEAVLAQRGAPYAVVNNVGITRDTVLMNMSTEQWQDVVATNLNSAFFVTRFFVRSQIEQREGVILQMSSVSGVKGNTGQTNYGATKAALIGMTRSLALELGRFNVRVNAIAPGYIATEMVGEIPEKKIKLIKDSIPLRRLGTVREVAALALYLASTDAAYVTGQTFVIDGGLSA